MNWAWAILLILVGTVSASASEEGAFFDLFGQPVDPSRINQTGAMPAGELKLVLDPSAPRFGVFKRRRSGRSSGAVNSAARRIPLGARPVQTVINVDQAVFATHLVKSGNRLVLRHY